MACRRADKQVLHRDGVLMVWLGVEQAGEERNLMGLCGSATCPHTLYSGKHRSKIFSGHLGVTYLDNTSYCRFAP